MSLHVDRRDELQLFDDMLAGRREERILLVQAPSGLGKSLLMLEYGRMARRAGVPRAICDLRCVGVAPFDVLATVCDDWIGCPFDTFRRQVADLQRPGADVTVRGVVQIGRPTIQVAMSDPNEGTRRERRRLVTQALMADVRAWLGGRRRAVLLLDSYDPPPSGVTPEMRQWVEGALLPSVRRTPGLMAVVAGQTPPAVSAMWEEVCCRMELPPLDDPDDWMEFVRAEQIPVSRQIVAAFCHEHGGHPVKVALALSAMRGWGGAS